MSNLTERKNAPRQGVKAVPKPGGKFVGAMQRLAQKRSKSRSVAPLQVGNMLTKKAALGGSKAKFESGISKPAKSFAPVKATEAQTGLNPEQQGASQKNAQRKGK